MEFVESVDLSMFLRAKIKTTDIFKNITPSDPLR